MKVYIGFQHSYDYAEEWKNVVKIFDDEVKTLIWKDDFDIIYSALTGEDRTAIEWRTYEEFEVE